MGFVWLLYAVIPVRVTFYSIDVKLSGRRPLPSSQAQISGSFRTEDASPRLLSIGISQKRLEPIFGEKLPLDLDVMTVHHPDYYQGKDDAPPADWDSPTPVAFVSARGRYLLAVTGPEEWAGAAIDILKHALEHDGIGAKTAAGYGRMTWPPDMDG